MGACNPSIPSFEEAELNATVEGRLVRNNFRILTAQAPTPECNFSEVSCNKHRLKTAKRALGVSSDSSVKLV